MKDVMILTGAGQIGMAIARRMGYGMKIVVGDKSMENAQAISKTMNDAGFDTVPVEMDLSSRESILNIIAEAQKYGEISMMVNAAGVSPSQAPVEAILKVDLYGTAVLLEEVGKVIKKGGVGVTISSQSGWRMPALTAEEDELLATTPTEELLSLPLLQSENIRDTLHAYQLAKRCNEKRVMAEAVKWGQRGARINDIAPGIIVTPLAIDEFNGPRGDFYKNMFANCPAGRPGTADEVANVAELLMSDRGAFITGSTILIDGGATASYFYGPLKEKPENPETDKEVIENSYRKLYRGMLECDRAALESVFADNGVLVHMTGTRQPRADYIQAVMDGKIRYPSAEHEKIEVTVDGDKAAMIGQSIVEAVGANGSNTWRLQMDIDLEKIDGQWKMLEVRTSTY